MNEDRLFCPLSPCLPVPLDGKLTNEHVRESRSFGDFDAYYRHVEWGHFMSKANAPVPLCLDEEPFDFLANFAAGTKGR